mmetsp:Transcript_18187/g.51308  ORF Transcript_18187/g.51308 Transcript_18187/m.51308 type:complete len:194 (+) Transcript_18187:180-761(+)
MSMDESGKKKMEERRFEGRMEKLRLALLKALELSLDEVTIKLLKDCLGAIAEDFKDRKMLENLQVQIRRNLLTSCEDEFLELCQDMNLPEQLARLDQELAARELGQASKGALPPEDTQKVVVMQAKEREVDRLQEMLSQLEKENESLKSSVIVNETLLRKMETMAKTQGTLMDKTMDDVVPWLESDAAKWCDA